MAHRVRTDGNEAPINRGQFRPVHRVEFLTLFRARPEVWSRFANGLFRLQPLRQGEFFEPSERCLDVGRNGSELRVEGFSLFDRETLKPSARFLGPKPLTGFNQVGADKESGGDSKPS